MQYTSLSFPVSNYQRQPLHPIHPSNDLDTPLAIELAWQTQLFLGHATHERSKHGGKEGLYHVGQCGEFGPIPHKMARGLGVRTIFLDTTAKERRRERLVYNG